jgi:segregation and condensation protein B
MNKESVAKALDGAADEAALNEEASRELEAMVAAESTVAEGQESDDPEAYVVQNAGERIAILEALIFVSEEPLTAKTMAEVLREDREVITEALAELAREFNGRNAGLQLREVAGGWQFATRPQYHEHVRAFLKSRPSAKLSIASLETLAVIAYKQPVTVPEILEIRGVQSRRTVTGYVGLVRCFGSGSLPDAREEFDFVFRKPPPFSRLQSTPVPATQPLLRQP